MNGRHVLLVDNKQKAGLLLAFRYLSNIHIRFAHFLLPGPFRLRLHTNEPQFTLTPTSCRW